MSITTLIPKIRVCISNNNTTLTVYDTTRPYNLASNSGGWGTTNIVAADIDAATVTYTAPAGSPIVNDVLTAVNAQLPVVDEYVLGTYTVPAVDGEYTFTYELTDTGGEIVSVDHTIFWMGSVRCCIDKLWAKHAQHLIDAECLCTGKSTPYDIQAVEAEGIYGAIVNGVSCTNTVERDKLLKKLQRICKLNKCNC
tara:strand:+ start:5837 stop:6424 length:588 start_codon:yes stop_codon:yes gene_type:complete